MPQLNAGENTFIKGLVTEASGLNFPEGAVTETYDCEFNLDGSVNRRLGFDFEDSYALKTIDRTNKAIATYLWRNVSGNGDVNLQVVQIGDTIYFYEIGTAGSYSLGAITSTVTLTAVSGAPVVDTIEAQFSDGNGLLFVTHPYCEPMRISYDTSTSTATATNITVQIRDFEGAVADSNAVDARPSSSLAALDVSHKYNLYNQGWNTTNLTAWDTAQTTMPSNADVMWRFVDSSNNFDASTAAIARVNLGNTHAPNGHFIAPLSNLNRDTASGLSGVAATTTSYFRPSTSAFFAGRLWYSGINYTGFNSNIYFSQIVEKTDQYGLCYQDNDPTASDLFDELPSDGGLIRIPEAGTIIKLFPVPGGLCVFGANGVWFITGSTGLGFTATDYTVQQIAKIPALSATSFVSVGGFPCWWNADNIYILSAQGNIPTATPLTYTTIKTFYDDIPLDAKRYARGFYHSIDNHVRWIYNSQDTVQLSDVYEFDRILSFNTATNAFYPWTVGDSDVKINSIINTDLVTRNISLIDVVDDVADFVIDGSGNQVIAYSSAGTNQQIYDFYLVSYPESSSYKFTFASKSSDTYKDWYTYDSEGVDYTSYFISGYKLSGGGSRKFQNNWVRVFSETDAPVSYHFQGLWDYATTGSNTGRWSAKQYINHTNTSYSNASARLKVRGHGLTLQFKITSISGEPFHVIGWSAQQTVNKGP